MKKTAFLFLVVILSGAEALGSPSGLTLACQAAHQPNGPGTPFTKAALAETKQDADSQTLAIEHQGHTYQVLWHFSLTTLYMSIWKNGARVASSTARVPDKNHNDSMLDIGLSPRVWLSCDFVEYRPKP